MSATDADALEAIADLHLATGAGWKDDGRAGFIERVRAILAKTGPAAIDRGALLELLSDETGWDWDGEQDEPAPIFGCDTRVPSSRQALEAFADQILALVRPVEAVAFTGDRLRAELLASLPADPKWVAWVDGVLDRLELPGGVTLSREDASLAAHFVRDHIGTGWADPIWPTDDHLRALVARLEGASS